MATFTITTPVNIDSLASKVGGDIYNINGGYLTIDQDSRFGLNQNTSASLGNMTLSATLGGTCEVNATKVRLIPYNTGTGTVPANNTAISMGGASGLLIGVYSALNVAPTASGGAMPVSGYIKIKQWNSVAYSAGVLTGISAVATGADQAGWIELVGDEAGTVTVNRLNLWKMRGDWYDFLGAMTDGTRATTYQIPSNGALQYHAGVWVETGTATGIYEFYPCAGTLTALLANIATDAVRGKVCWVSTAGLLRFGHDGTNSTGGYIPPAGRKIRIANIFTQNCTTAARTANVLPNATLATRYDFTTTGGGAIDIDKAMLGWYPSFAQPYSVALTNVGILTQLSVSEIASPIAWSNVGVGQEAANTQIPILTALCFAGGTMDRCTWTRANESASGAYCVSMTDCSGFTVTNEWSFSFIKSANATTGTHSLTRVASSTWTTTKMGAGRVFLTTCTDVKYTNTTYYDHPALTTTTAIPMYMFDTGTGCKNCTFDGVDFGGLTLVQPYSGILQVGSAGCTNIKLRNLGTYASPLDMGATQQDAVAWSRATTVATITKTAHGLKVNDIINCLISSDTGAIVVGAKTVATVANANTFTFTALNAGDTTGTLSYYPTMSAFLVVLGGGAAANNVKCQRCYTPHLRTGAYSIDNSSKNFLVESVYGDFVSNSGMTGLNASHKAFGATQFLSASTAVYGSHWFDMFTNEVTPNIIAQAWDRTTTVATITSMNHGLRTGLQVVVNTSSDATAIVLGIKTVTVLTKDTFTFACLNAGLTAGTLTFIPINGRIGIMMNESTVDTVSQYTLDAGSPQFTSAGSLYIPTITQQITFETPYSILGHDVFPITQPVMAGGTIGNYDITYAIETGSGYSAFKNLSYPRAGGGGASASTNVTMTNTTGVSAGDYVFGTNIAPNAKVSSITNGTTVVVDIANIGTVSGVLIFNQIPNETIPATGAKLKIRVKTTTTNATAITSLYIPTNSSSTTRAYQYPLDTNTLTLTGLISGTQVDAYTGTIGGSSVNIGNTNSSGTSFAFQHSSGGISGYITLIINGYNPLTIPITFSASDISIPIQQIVDPVFTP